MLGTLAVRLYYLQAIEAERCQMLADQNRICIRLVASPRGRILDRFGVVFAKNTPAYRLVIIAEQAGDVETTLDALGQLVPVSDADWWRVMREPQAQLRTGGGSRRPDMGADVADRGQHAGTARRVYRAEPAALLTLSGDAVACCGLCRRGLRGRAGRRGSRARTL